MASLIHIFIWLAAGVCNFIRHRLPGGAYIWWCLDVFLLFVVDISRLFCAHHVAEGIENCQRPQKPLILYEFEACPFCRKVREALTVLDIDYICFPCPRETLRQKGLCINSKHRPHVQQAGGRLSFPYLEDPNTGRKMYESSEIVEYLWKTYGSEAVPSWRYRLANNPLWFRMSCLVCAAARPCADMGCLRAPAHKACQPLELWGYESSPFVRRVREKLSMLELPYLFHNVPHGSKVKRALFTDAYSKGFNQQRLRKTCGLIQVPFLKDPNSNSSLFESDDIARYLAERYQTAPPPNECWLDYGRDDRQK